MFATVGCIATSGYHVECVMHVDLRKCLYILHAHACAGFTSVSCLSHFLVVSSCKDLPYEIYYIVIG